MAKDKSKIKNKIDAIEYLARELTIQSVGVSVLNYIPHDKQLRFHKSEKDIRLYIGGNRSGKTIGSVMEGIYWSRKQHPYQRLPLNPYEPVRGRVCAVDFNNGLEKIILPAYSAAVPKSMLINGSWSDSYNANEKVLTFRDRSFIEFMSYDQDLDKFAGTSRHWVHMDEEPPKSIYTENGARVVDTDGRMWISMTPVEGMTWVFDTIYEPGLNGDNENIDIIIVDMMENPHLTERAVRKYIATLDAEDLDARIHGRFIQMGGLIYKQFDPEIGGRHIISTEDIILKPPKNWEIGLSLDHGLNNPAAALWHMLSPEGEIVTYKEIYQKDKTVEEMAGLIKDEIVRQRRIPDFFIADPAIKQRSAHQGASIQEEYTKHQIYWGLGNNDVKAGLLRVKNYLRPRKAPDGQERPLWHITTDCPKTIWEFKKYRWKTYETKDKQYDNNAFEEPHKKDDHAMDSLRYFVMSRPNLFADIEEEEPHRKGEIIVPGSVDFGATAQDFHSLRNAFNNPEDYGLPERNGSTQWDFDEHMGGVW